MNPVKDFRMNPFATSERGLLKALVISTIPIALFLRYLWSLSLGNGDELFFSTAAGTFDIGQGTWAQWSDFFYWLWWEHTGRTADWISGAIYLLGDGVGRWLASILATLSAGIITWCLYRLSKYFGLAPTPPAIAVPVSLLTLLFSYSAAGLTPLVNLTFYSAAVANYFVPGALIFAVLTMAMVSNKTSTLYLASIIGSITATMHEQAAIILLVLVILLVVADPQRRPLQHRLISSLIVLAGVVEMFLSPGLHAKLTRVAAAQPEVVTSVPHKILITFYTFGAYYSIMGLLTSALVVAYLVAYICQSRQTVSSWILIVVLGISTTVWLTGIRQLGIESPFSSHTLNGLACIVMVITWLITPLISNSNAVRFGSVLLIAAGGSLAIPAAAGLSAVRVLNFPIIFLMGFQLWTMHLGVHAATTSSFNKMNVKQFLTSAAIPTALLVLSMLAIINTTIAFEANSKPGLEDLTKQDIACSQARCPAQDPQIPYPKAFAGYGNHDYASTRSVLEWLGQ
ncbi:hypothetical protein [Actinomyces sp. HMSC065F11]|uniref:hypothetical protein n=1 Tax=Actinomyces sp. HMSC065F11 TaxID=1739395 RepID=UPI001C999CBE|nr:hypothetical protein [Actinomyces sp. HMSC065F11]